MVTTTALQRALAPNSIRHCYCLASMMVITSQRCKHASSVELWTFTPAAKPVFQTNLSEKLQKSFVIVAKDVATSRSPEQGFRSELHRLCVLKIFETLRWWTTLWGLHTEEAGLRERSRVPPSTLTDLKTCPDSNNSSLQLMCYGTLQLLDFPVIKDHYET